MSTLRAYFIAQGGECFYCGQEAWLTGDNDESRDAAKMRLGVPTNKALLRRQATIEHLTRRADGGKTESRNVAMACKGCNSRRHKTPVLLHLGAMRSEAALLP